MNFHPFLTLEEAYDCLFSKLGHIKAWMPDREQFHSKIWDYLAAGKLVAIRDGAEIPVAAWDIRPEWTGFKIRRDDVLTIWGRGPPTRSSVPLLQTPWPVARVELVRSVTPAQEAKEPVLVSKQDLDEYLRTLAPCNPDDAWREAEKHFNASIDRDRVRNSKALIRRQVGRPRVISK